MTPPCDNCGGPSRGTVVYQGRTVNTCTGCAADHGLPMVVIPERYSPW